jgi:hypothetical protein
MQWYKGEQYLTYWAGIDEGGHGVGSHHMIDKHYQEFKVISAHGESYSADLHEFMITPDNTALLTVYDTTWVDYTNSSTSETWQQYVQDCLFQEIDIETNELLFEWRASEHFNFEDSFNLRANVTRRPSPLHSSGQDSAVSIQDLPQRAARLRGWDWFHLNSVSKDHLGNYLISARYSHSLTYISKLDGSIVWQLGGKHNDFTDVSDSPYQGYATSLSFQHHATWIHDEPNTVLVFDNQASNWNRTESARALKIRLNTDDMTAKVVAVAEHPQGYIVPSQGSVQQLTNGNLFVGYGFTSAMTEFSPNGKEVICDWQYGALHARNNGTYSPGMIQSYRAFKQPWQGYPKQLPKIKIAEIDLRLLAEHDEEQVISPPRRPSHVRPGSRPGTSEPGRPNLLGRARGQDADEAAEEEADEVMKLLHTKQTRMWISWNGATEVKTWALERRLILPVANVTAIDEAGSRMQPPEPARINASSWILIHAIPKAGFESSLAIPIYPDLLAAPINMSTVFTWQSLKNQTEYRLRALDAGEGLLGLWHIDHEGIVMALPVIEEDTEAWSFLDRITRHPKAHSLRYILAWTFGLATCLLLVWAWHRGVTRRKGQGSVALKPYEDLRPSVEMDEEPEDEEAGALIRGELDWDRQSLEEWHEDLEVHRDFRRKRLRSGRT